MMMRMPRRWASRTRPRNRLSAAVHFQVAGSIGSSAAMQGLVAARVGAEVAVDVVVVPGVVLVQRGCVVHRVEIQGGDAEILEIVEPVDDALQVAAVAAGLYRRVEVLPGRLGPGLLPIPVLRPGRRPPAVGRGAGRSLLRCRAASDRWTGRRSGSARRRSDTRSHPRPRRHAQVGGGYLRGDSRAQAVARSRRISSLGICSSARCRIALPSPRRFAFEGPFQRRDVELLHLQHRLHGALRLLPVRIAHHLDQRRRHHLPRQAELVLEPAALLRRRVAALRSACSSSGPPPPGLGT